MILLIAAFILTLIAAVMPMFYAGPVAVPAYGVTTPTSPPTWGWRPALPHPGWLGVSLYLLSIILMGVR